MDKPVTGEDARRVQSAEQRNDPLHVSHARGIAAHMQAAATFNEAAERVAAHEPRYPHGYKPGARVAELALTGFERTSSESISGSHR